MRLSELEIEEELKKLYSFRLLQNLYYIHNQKMSHDYKPYNFRFRF